MAELKGLNHRYAAQLWLLVILLLILSLCYLIPISRLNTSVLEMLPKQHTTSVPAELQAQLQKRLDTQLVWLIKPAIKNDLTAVHWFYQQLKQQDFIATVEGEMDPSFQQAWGRFAFEHRYLLLDNTTRLRLQKDQQQEWVLSQLYSPFSGVTAQELAHDPFLLTRASQLNQTTQAPTLQLSHNWLSANDDKGQTWYMIYAELAQSSFNLNQAHDSVLQLEKLSEQLRQQWPESTLLKRGMLFYSDYASERAQDDIGTIGSLSVLGITLMVLVIFRSIKPLFLTLLSISIGLLSGLVAVLVLFGEIHILTLVMSTSIVGIAEDYATHFLVERMLHGKQESAQQSLAKLKGTFVVALLTSLIAYIVLLVTPFPGLQQLAIFAIFGLIATFFTVVCWYPYLARGLPVREQVGHQWGSIWLSYWLNPRFRWVMTLLALLFIGYGISRIQIDDDIARLQAMPAQLIKQEQQIAAITQQQREQKWLLVYAKEAEQTLQRLEALQPQLEQAKQQGWISHYQMINLPSLARQRDNLHLIEQHAPELSAALNQAGLLHSFMLTTKEQHLLTPDEWLQSPYSQGGRLLWLTAEPNLSASLIPVSGVKNIPQLITLAEAQPGVSWIDKHSEYNALFSHYRIQLSYLLTIAVIIICLSFFIRHLRYGLKTAFICCLPTLLSIGSAFALLGWLNQPLNLFALLAFILVIGMGIDYSLFMSNAKSMTSSSLLAVSMAAITTFLSFGLLALSHTSAIVSFGLVITGGIVAAFLFSPLAIPPTASQKKEHT